MQSDEIKLFNNYLKLQDKNYIDNIKGYRSHKEPGKDISIRVNFKDDTWMTVYYKNKGTKANIINVNFKNGEFNYKNEIECIAK